MGFVVLRHSVHRYSEAAFGVPAEFAGQSTGFKRWTVIDESTRAVHTGFRICALEAGGSVAAHLHSFEESMHVLEGEVELRTAEDTCRLRPGDYGVVPVGVPHAWRNPAGPTARWAEMVAPQPRARLGHETFFVSVAAWPTPVPVDVRDPRTRSFGHIEPSNMDVNRQSQDQVAVSTSMRTALLEFSGITVKMMVDTDLGAQLSTMFMVEFQTKRVAQLHDHPFEETYFILEGEADTIFDGKRYHLTAGDIAFAGVGCVHSFSNPAKLPVRWLETQAPQPPARHSYRFARDWDYLQEQTND